MSDHMPFGITSSPKYPRSNGLAERAIEICKTILRKCAEDESDVHVALSEYRTSLLTGLNASPSEFLNNRLLRTTIPSTTETSKTRPNLNQYELNNKRL